ncbi:mitochondrial ribosomal protein L27 precursor, putative [Plasmodium gallinaceum]|uniref:Mitochondrial ribosomal protein L27, putative n=1 Tax=Plasmodium gallinaceum TaxID=5849 RepID=A0A1J1GPD4_PLAGA|nr:mitochondrial ribosomal protein L27 precursor, putative [Plasmodium gallinaceum]CRG94298.1 mitochondrial ribosomal protein L27 precursor, putative [Plasmodium gallinaceum]
MTSLFQISSIFNKINKKQYFNYFNLINKKSLLMNDIKLRYISTGMNNFNLIINKNIKNNISKFNLIDKKRIFMNNIRQCNVYTNMSIYKQNDNGNCFLKIFKRNKMVKTSSYRRKSRSSPNGQGQKAKIGIKRLSGEYVKTGQMLVKQRKIIAFNYEKKTRKRNFKYYPGENVKVSKNTSLIALTNGRVKYTFHVLQNILIVNILPEELEELKEEDLYRYRTEHVKSFEENRSLVYLRMKNIITFPKFKNTQYIKPPLKPQFLTKYDIYDNPTLQEVPILYHKKN